jgi:flagellar export protein FliJ
MKSLRREEQALARLLKVAGLRVDEITARLADAEAARASAQSAIDWLLQAVRTEEARCGASPAALADFARYLAGAAEKRRTLQATRDRLGAEIAALRADLSEAAIESRKLEHLAGLKTEEIAAAERRRDAARLDEAAAQRRRG